MYSVQRGVVVVGSGFGAVVSVLYFAGNVHPRRLGDSEQPDPTPKSDNPGKRRKDHSRSVKAGILKIETIKNGCRPGNDARSFVSVNLPV